MPEREMGEILKEHTDEMMALPGVVGIGIGELQGSPCIMVFVVEKSSEVLSKIPNSLEGYPIQVRQSGQFRARKDAI